MDENFEPQTLIRRFSDKLAEDTSRNGSDSAFRKGFVQDVQYDEQSELEDIRLRQWFEAWKPTTPEDQRQFLLKREARDLFEAWAKFKQQLPPEEKVRFTGQAMGFDDVVQTMSSVGQKWETARRKGKAGTARTWWTECCLTIKSHENLLRIIPEDSEYTSLFTGVLKSVVYATANHEKVTASLSRAIKEIGDTVAWSQEVRSLYDTKEMQEAIMELYAHVFDFFKEVLNWYGTKRFKRMIKSFNEDLYDKYQAKIVDIQKIAQRMKDRALGGQSAEVRVTRRTNEQVLAEVQQLSRDVQASRQEQMALQFRLWEEFAQKTLEPWKAHMLKEAKQFLLESMQTNHVTALPNSDRALLEDIPESTMSSIVIDGDHKAAVAAKLEAYFDPDRIRPSIDTNMGVVLTDNVTSRLREFVVGIPSILLAITGPRKTHGMTPSTMTQVSASILASAISAGLPTISYFCEMNRDLQLQEGQTRESVALIALMYALLKQLLDLSLSEQTSVDFGNLDGTLSSWPQALSILDDLLLHAPPLLYVIIDGWQCLDDDSTELELDELFALLHSHSTYNERIDIVCKVLLTTSGRSRSLNKNWTNTDMIIVDDGGTNSRNARGGHRQALRFDD